MFTGSGGRGGLAQAKACGYGWVVRFVLGLVLWLSAPGRVRAQVVPDTSGVGVDSMGVVADTAAALRDTLEAVGPPMGFMGVGGGEIVGVDTLPARLPVLDLTEILGRVPGSFVYAFETPGWPDGWSPHGLRPEQVRLVFQH
ncbi:MAG TPA: hypothetical protein VFG50_16140, partial [Rhodothermales bacterium]|nr:hypothetical protein [Rhodothermales bacterium]